MQFQDIEWLKDIVQQAGVSARSQFGAIEAEHKADHSLVTEVDRSNERFLRAEVTKRFPKHAFIGEEYGWTGDEDAPVWACDPIDGTTNFVRGLPAWCVSLGLIHKGVPQAGAIYMPETDEMVWAVRGQGAYLNGRRITVKDTDNLEPEDTICLTSNCVKTLETRELVGRIRCFGSIAIELAYTAAGRLVATVGLHEGIVDIAAALCICFEAGCEFRYLSGENVDIEALLRNRRTERHFVYAPPRLQSYLRGALKPKE